MDSSVAFVKMLDMQVSPRVSTLRGVSADSPRSSCGSSMDQGRRDYTELTAAGKRSRA